MKIYIPFSIYMEIYKPFRLLGNRHLILCVILLHDILYKYTYCTNTRIVQIRINTYILLRLLGNRHLILCVILLHDILYKHT